MNGHSRRWYISHRWNIHTECNASQYTESNAHGRRWRWVTSTMAHRTPEQLGPPWPWIHRLHHDFGSKPVGQLHEFSPSQVPPCLQPLQQVFPCHGFTHVHNPVSGSRAPMHTRSLLRAIKGGIFAIAGVQTTEISIIIDTITACFFLKASLW